MGLGAYTDRNMLCSIAHGEDTTLSALCSSEMRKC